MLAPGQRVSVAVEKPAAGGRMLARADGQVVLVAGAIPGERVAATVERVGRGVAYARVIDIEAASPDRRPPFTDPDCGCAYAHIDYARQLVLKGEIVADAFQRIGKLHVPPPAVRPSSPTDGYRMRARLHLHDGRLAFYREGTHTPCDARGTRQLLSATCDALDRLASTLINPNVVSGFSRTEVLISENIDASARTVHVESSPPLDRSQLEGLGDVEGFTGVTAAAANGQVAVVAGAPYVVDGLDLDGRQTTLRRHVLAFFQANRHLVRELVSHVMQQIPAQDRVVDLYAGVGLFAVPLSARGNAVTAVEGDRFSAQDLQDNARASVGSLAAIHRPVEMFLDRQPERPDTLIVDPPRTGMSREAIQGAVNLAAPHVVYVSCDVATLARDARRLVDAGYGLTSLSAFDMFPNTAHVENVVVFQRSG